MTLPRYLTQLDALRGIAVLVVMVSHSNGNVPSLHLGAVFHYGWTGVDLFFVLSGFLITGILLRTRSDPDYFSNFYARRVLRIWPLYFCLLAFCFLVVPGIQPQLRPTVAEQCHPWQTYLFFVQNLIVPRSGTFGPLQLTWSLCVEEQFYLVWPLVVLFCSPKNIARIATGAVLFSLGLRFAGAHHWFVIDTYHNTLCRLDGLAIGSLAALLVPRYDTRLVRKAALWLGALAIAGIAAAILLSIRWTFLGFVSLLFGAVMCFSITLPAFPKARFLAFTGRISYGLYLLHAPAFDIVRNQHVRSLIAVTHNVVVNDIIALVCSMGLAFGFAFASWKLLESPVLSLKRYFEPDRNRCLLSGEPASTVMQH
jgi:peptidoglycan/LPS O-acetylase OafA/YrhL